jgi:predicted permease
MTFLQAWRALARRRAFTLATILTLGAGIAVTATMFTIVDGVLLRPLPFPDADRLVAVYEAHPGNRERVSLMAPARVEEWNRLNRTFESISSSYFDSVTDTSTPEPERLDARRVTARFFDVHRMAPLAGRTFVPDEERFGGGAAAVISEALWARRFGRSPAAIGSRLTIGGVAHPIVGVMPRAFSGAATDVWLPAQIAPGLMQAREARFLSGVGRLRPGVTPADAQRDLGAVQARLGEQFPTTDKDWSAEVRDMKDVRVGTHRRPLLAMFGAVVLLFAIAVANVAGLMLVQLHRRAGEFAIRAAIGASRAQMAGAVMREAAILAVAGAAIGGALTIWLTRAAAAGLTAVPRSGELRVDLRVLLFVMAASAAAALLFGLAPAAVATRARISTLLSSTGRGASTRHRLQGALVVAQLALGVVLAGSAGLLLRSYGALAGVDTGFDAGPVLTFHVGATWDEDRVRIGQLQERLLSELERIPGVEAAGFANFLPAPGATLRYQVAVDGVAGTDAAGFVTVGQRTVTPGYMRALGIPLVAGAWCPAPRAGAPSGAMVNRRFVDQFAAGQNLLGRTLRFNQMRSTFTITAVAGDVLEDGPGAPAIPFVYVCLPYGSWPDPNYVVRAHGDPRALAAAVRQIVKSLDAARPVFGMRTLAEVIDAALDQPRLNARAIAVFAAAALGLAALGLYGLLMLLVGERRREIGVRIALGATPMDVVGDVVGGAGRLVAAGIGAGVVLLLAAGPLLRTLLFGVAPYDPRSIAAGAGALAVAALAAVLLPAHHASRIDAVDAMRELL